MSPSPWLVVVGAGRWQVHGIRCARAAGLRVLALDGAADAPGLAIADQAAVVDIRNSEEVIAVICKAGITPSGAIAFCSEVAMDSVAAVREAFDLSGPKSELTLRLRDKESQRARWTESGSPVPSWQAVSTEKEALSALNEVGLPLIVKPVDSAGSRGVTRVDTRSELIPAFQAALTASKRGRVIIESYIAGIEYTIESFSCNGKTSVLLVTSKRKVEGTRGTVASELTSVAADSELFSKLASVTSKALSDLGYTDGPGHTEIIVSSEGEAVLVESAGRGGGFSLFDEMIPLTSGFDIATASALQSAGLAFAAPASNLMKASILRFIPSQVGTVVGIHGFAQVSLGFDVHAEPLVELGQVCESAHSDGDRMAYILATADTMDEAERLANRAESSIHFEMSTNEQSEDNRHTLALG
ncbi:MAG: ATP-grasp domain-containing protein [Kofleriaceae bacterium]|nr:ATP-grasp domain-containing protein [Kofleriaceae bacterium]